MRLERLVEPVVYGDVFDYPLSLAELHRFCPFPLTVRELEREIERNERFARLVSRREGLYFLRGREELVEIRRERGEASRKAWRQARRVVSWIRYVPFIRGILVTGSLAVDNARRKDDLDFLVLTERGRLWQVFFVLGLLQRLFLKRFLCPNYYIAIDHLELGRRSPYVAREAAQARALFGAETCRRFRDANRWILEHYPNAAADGRDEERIMERTGLLRLVSGGLEWLTGGRLGDALEARLARVLKRRLVAHYGKFGQDVPEEVLRNALAEIELRFHGLDHEEGILSAIRSREDRLRPLLSEDTDPANGTR